MTKAATKTTATKKTATKTTVTAAQKRDWWDGLSETDRARRASGFSNPNSPTASEITEAYDDAHGSNGEPGGQGMVGGAEAVAAAHQVIADAKARKKDLDAETAAKADDQRATAEEGIAADEAAKAEAGDPVIALPDIDPKVPLTKDEQNVIAKAREVIAQVPNDPNAPVLTEEAMDRIADAEDLPPASKTLPIPTPGASATNPALMRNDVDVEKTPPFGQGSAAHLQG